MHTVSRIPRVRPVKEVAKPARSTGRRRLEAASTALSLAMVAGLVMLPAMSLAGLRAVLSPDAIASLRTALRTKPAAPEPDSQPKAAPVITTSPIRTVQTPPAATRGTGGPSATAPQRPVNPVATVSTEPEASEPGMLVGLWGSIERAIAEVAGKLSKSAPEPAPATPAASRPSSPVRTIETTSGPVRPAASPVSPVRTIEAPQSPAKASGPASTAASPVRTVDAAGEKPPEKPQAAASGQPGQAEAPTTDGSALATSSLARLRAAVEPLLSSVWSRSSASTAEPAAQPKGPDEPVVVAALPAAQDPAVRVVGPDTPVADPASDDAAAKSPGPIPGPPIDPKKSSAAQIFGALKAPSGQPARVIGTYSKGCLAGAQELAPTGPSWQAMRLSRNRNWGHPSLVRFVEQLAGEVKEKVGWPGLLVGDLSQPRGGPMTFGHASHQIGLDVDIWYLPMPDRQLAPEERDRMPMPTVLVNPNRVDPNLFTDKHAQVVRRAAAQQNVERVLVHPAVKKALCESPEGDRAVLRKIRPYWGHDDHFHVRLACPSDSVGCQPAPAAPADDGCGKELDHWLALAARMPTPQPPSAVPGLAPDLAAEQPKPISASAKVGIDALPAQCKVVHSAPPAQTAAR